jgi:eukaryotic-like serine/threonine-protein kinase
VHHAPELRSAISVTETPVPQPGTLLAGKYRVERTLGKGGMAVVVEATNVALGQRVAVKVLQGNVAKLDEMTRRFEREAQIAAQLPPEHVARVFDFGTLESGEPFLVMELLIGRDLADELWERGPLPIEEAVDYVLQACEGVAEAHAAGLVHRDLKPENLFVTKRRDGSPLVKVLDFGISKVDSKDGDMSLTKTQSNFGTPLYMSPEQMRSVKNVDARADQHAMGAILYALLTGTPPYEADTLTALAVVIATQPPPPLLEKRSDAPVGIEAVIHRTLAKRPEERFPSLAEFAAAIAPFGGGGAARSARAIAAVLGEASALSRPSLSSLASIPSLRPISRSGTPTARASQSPSGPPSAPTLAADRQPTHVAVTTAVEQPRARRSRQVLVGVALALLVGVGVGFAAIGPKTSKSAARSPAVAEPNPTAVSSAPPPVTPASTASGPSDAPREIVLDDEATPEPAPSSSSRARGKAARPTSAAGRGSSGRAAPATQPRASTASTTGPRAAATPGPPREPAPAPTSKPQKPLEVFNDR